MYDRRLFVCRWKPPGYILNMPEERHEQVRKKNHIIVEGENPPPPVKTFKVSMVVSRISSRSFPKFTDIFLWSGSFHIKINFQEDPFITFGVMGNTDRQMNRPKNITYWSRLFTVVT